MKENGNINHAEMCVIWPLKHFLGTLHGSAEYSAESLEKIAEYSVSAESDFEGSAKFRIRSNLILRGSVHHYAKELVKRMCKGRKSSRTSIVKKIIWEFKAVLLVTLVPVLAKTNSGQVQGWLYISTR